MRPSAKKILKLLAIFAWVGLLIYAAGIYFLPRFLEDYPAYPALAYSAFLVAPLLIYRYFHYTWLRMSALVVLGIFLGLIIVPGIVWGNVSFGEYMRQTNGNVLQSVFSAVYNAPYALPVWLIHNQVNTPP